MCEPKKDRNWWERKRVEQNASELIKYGIKNLNERRCKQHDKHKWTKMEKKNEKLNAMKNRDDQTMKRNVAKMYIRGASWQQFQIVVVEYKQYSLVTANKQKHTRTIHSIIQLR